jgi:hypothetical protein
MSSKAETADVFSYVGSVYWLGYVIAWTVAVIKFLSYAIELLFTWKRRTKLFCIIFYHDNLTYLSQESRILFLLQKTVRELISGILDPLRQSWEECALFSFSLGASLNFTCFFFLPQCQGWCKLKEKTHKNHVKKNSFCGLAYANAIVMPTF